MKEVLYSPFDYYSATLVFSLKFSVALFLFPFLCFDHGLTTHKSGNQQHYGLANFTIEKVYLKIDLPENSSTHYVTIDKTIHVYA